MAGRIPCTCGCGLQVTYATKLNHINGRGKTSLRARVLAETELLRRNTRQQQKPGDHQRGSKKRASSNLDQDGTRKRLKGAQLEENELPEVAPTFQVDTDAIEDLLPVVDTHRQNEFVERTGRMMEMRWGTSRQGNGLDGDSEGGDNDEDGDNKNEDEDEDEDEDGDEDGDEDEDEDEDDPSFFDSEIPGLSAWDLLGEAFEREAAALGLSSSVNYLPG